VIDYLQLIEAGEGKGDKNGDVSTITRSLKNLAKELDLPIVELSQLSRAVEARGGSKRPTASRFERFGKYRTGQRRGDLSIQAALLRDC
jgi:replicative DNA helicase